MTKQWLVFTWRFVLWSLLLRHVSALRPDSSMPPNVMLQISGGASMRKGMHMRSSSNTTICDEAPATEPPSNPLALKTYMKRIRNRYDELMTKVHDEPAKVALVVDKGQNTIKANEDNKDMLAQLKTAEDLTSNEFRDLVNMLDLVGCTKVVISAFAGKDQEDAAKNEKAKAMAQKRAEAAKGWMKREIGDKDSHWEVSLDDIFTIQPIQFSADNLKDIKIVATAFIPLKVVAKTESDGTEAQCAPRFERFKDARVTSTPMSSSGQPLNTALVVPDGKALKFPKLLNLALLKGVQWSKNCNGMKNRTCNGEKGDEITRAAVWNIWNDRSDGGYIPGLFTDEWILNQLAHGIKFNKGAPFDYRQVFLQTMEMLKYVNEMYGIESVTVEPNIVVDPDVEQKKNCKSRKANAHPCESWQQALGDDVARAQIASLLMYFQDKIGIGRESMGGASKLSDFSMILKEKGPKGDQPPGSVSAMQEEIKARQNSGKDTETAFQKWLLPTGNQHGLIKYTVNGSPQHRFVGTDGMGNNPYNGVDVLTVNMRTMIPMPPKDSR